MAIIDVNFLAKPNKVNNGVIIVHLANVARFEINV